MQRLPRIWLAIQSEHSMSDATAFMGAQLSISVSGDTPRCARPPAGRTRSGMMGDRLANRSSKRPSSVPLRRPRR